MKRIAVSLSVLVLLVVGAATVEARLRTPLLTCTQGYVGGEFYDVTVPADATCSLGGVTVTNDVKVRPGASLFLSNSIVGGKLKATDAASIEIVDSTIGQP